MLWKFVQQRLRTLKASWPIRFRQLLRALFLQILPWRHKLEAISEKISKQLWFQLQSHTVFVLLKDSQNTRNLWVIYLKNHFLEFHKVMRWHISGEVEKFTTFWCDASSKLLKSVQVWQSYAKQQKGGSFLRHSVVCWLIRLSIRAKITDRLQYIYCMFYIVCALCVFVSCFLRDK